MPKKTQQASHFVIRTHSSDEYGVDDAQFALVSIDQEAAKLLLARHKIFANAHAADKGLWEMYYWGAPVSFYSHEAVEEVLGADKIELAEDGTEITPMQAERLGKMEPCRVECEQTILRESGVAFTAIIKHTSLYVITNNELPLDDLEKLL